MRFALHVPNLADPHELVAMAVTAEEAGWDGFFVWDHVYGGPDFPVPMADPWVVLGGAAVKTERIRLGTAVTPLARRRPQKVARETVTVDQLSDGRMTLGVGLGNPLGDEFGAFGEPSDASTIAARLDESLEVLHGLWSAEPYDHQGRFHTVRHAQFLPAPVQRPRIPVWVAAQASRRRPLARAARVDGVILAAMNDDGSIDRLTAPQVGLALDEITRRRNGLEGFEVAIVSNGLPTQGDIEMYTETGVTWVLATGWVNQLHEALDSLTLATS